MFQTKKIRDIHIQPIDARLATVYPTAENFIEVAHKEKTPLYKVTFELTLSSPEALMRKAAGN